MRLQLIGGPRDGEWVVCCPDDPCDCQEFGHGTPGGNKVMDGYVEYLMYRRDRGGWVPDRIKRETCIVEGWCQSCGRMMPKGIINCKACGAEMDPMRTELGD